jgi:tRNA A37 threonylcarbamoyladenosine biosynthesis protein TsaE
VLLERTDQLSALADALDAVTAARAGAVVFVGGEAGAGTTALLRGARLARVPPVVSR